MDVMWLSGFVTGVIWGFIWFDKPNRRGDK